MGGADGLGQFVGRHVLQQVADGSCLQCILDQRFFCETGQGKHLYAGEALSNDTCGRHAIHIRHGQIHKHDVRQEARAQLNGFVAAGCFAGQFQVVGNLQEGRQTAPYHCMIIDEHDANRRGRVHMDFYSAFAIQLMAISVP